MRKFAVFMIMLLFAANAADYVAINSMDGRDVLSGVFYANAINVPVKFMPVPGGNADFFATKVGSGHDVFLIEGNVPVSSFVQNALQNNNNTIEVFSSSDGGKTNLELAKLSGVKKFIIVDSAFSDGALSVLPYAAKTDSYVLLANKDNVDDIKDLLEDAEKVTIYGYVDKEVRDGLSSFNPSTIGKGEDKFEDNIVIVDKTMKEFSLTTLTIVDGTSIEEAMTSGDQPILLAGRIVPQSTYDFIKDKVKKDELTTAMLIGNDLVVPIYDMRERMELEFEKEGQNKTFGIIVKFAQVIPSAGSGVLVLDEFPLPAYQPQIEIKDIFYNDQAGKVMVSVDNIGEGPAYFTQEVRIKVDGTDFKIFGSNETTLIERGEQLGTEYDLDLSQVAEGNVTALVLVKFGSSKKSLESFISSEGPLTTVTYTDKSNVGVQSANYDKDEGTVSVSIKNNGDEGAYVFSKLKLKVGGSDATISSADVRFIDSGSLIVEEFPLELSDEDLKANQNVTVFIDYGAREGFLLKQAAYVVPLKDEGMDLLIFVLFGLGFLVVLAALAVIAFYLMRKKPGKKKKG